MLIPISWLKDFVEIRLPLADLMWKMTEAGLTCEAFDRKGNEIVLDVEVTPNRPDWMSIAGVAREVAAIQSLSFRETKIKDFSKPNAVLPIKLKTNNELFDRWSAIAIKDVVIKPSPKWMQERLFAVGLRPINNIVDITNYVMFEFGIPMHAFDYDEIKGGVMTVQKAKGGEEFVSVDDISYKLPKDAMIICDNERIIDLVGIKGGANSGIKDTTKNILVHVTIDNPVLIRRASQALGLRSDASAIYERGPDKGGTVRSLKRAANLILASAGGKIASDIIDIKNPKVSKIGGFEPWKLSLSKPKLDKVLGISIEDKKVSGILAKLNLSPKKTKDGYECLIPTYRGDLKIEEDLIEEIARIYGYNNFPKTMPDTAISPVKIPYFSDDTFESKLKNLLVSAGFSEARSLSLISDAAIKISRLFTGDHIKLSNPVSLEYEYMRTSLVPSLLQAVRINQTETLKLFELDKVFLKNGRKMSEVYKISAVTKNVGFREFKGVIDFVFERLGISSDAINFDAPDTFWHPSKSGEIRGKSSVLGHFGQIHPAVCDSFAIGEDVLAFEFDVSTLNKHATFKKFTAVPLFPPQIEDLTLSLPPKTRVGDLISKIKSFSPQITKAELKDIYQSFYTFTIHYQSSEKTLDSVEVKEIRDGLIGVLKKEFAATVK